MSDFLDQVATQTGFANLVGCSQQAINKQAKKIGLSDGGSYRQWLLCYVNSLREEAAGRNYSSESEANSLKLRKLQGEVTALEISNARELGTLVLAQDGAAIVESLGKKFTSEIQTAQMQIINGIQSKYDIELDENVITSPMQSAARSCESHAGKLVDDIRKSIEDTTA